VQDGVAVLEAWRAASHSSPHPAPPEHCRV